MANHATTTVTCPSGNEYRVALSDDCILPFCALSRYASLSNVARVDQARVRLSLCVSQFMLMAERFYRDTTESERRLNKQRPSLPEGTRIAKIDEFAHELVFELSHWSELTDTVLDSRAVLSEMGYASETALEALAGEYEAHADRCRQATSTPYLTIDRVNISDEDLYAYANFDFACSTVSRIPELLTERIADYAMLRHKGVPAQTLVTAFTEAVDDLVRSGLVGATH